MGLSILGKDQILSKWDVLIGGADGKGEGVLADVEHLIEERRIPKAKLQRQNVASGLAQAAIGGSRPFLMITNHANANIKSCKLYINVRDYGASLQVSWYLVQQLVLWQRIIGFLLRIPVIGLLVLPAYAAGKLVTSKQSGILGLNIFDEQDLTAFTTTAHHCVQDAVDKLTKDFKLDLPRIDRTSKGFLNIT